MRTLGTILLAITAFAFAPGCSNIKLTDDGKNVIEMKQLDVLEKCENLGSVTANARNVNRTKEDEDRAVLARNMAAKMGGNVVVAQGEPVDNSREFTVYRCP